MPIALVLALCIAVLGCGGEDTDINGTYRGKGTMVVVVEEVITKIEIYFTGNEGFQFTGFRGYKESRVPIENGSFATALPPAQVTGTFKDGKVSGTWDIEGTIGQWSAKK